VKERDRRSDPPAWDMVGNLHPCGILRQSHGGVRILVGALALTAWSAAVAKQPDAQAVSALLKAKTQAFSDAGQRGDGRTMAAMLDDDVTFYNEGGERSGKVEMGGSTPGPNAAVKTRMTIENWSCRLYDHVAVTSFVDDQVQRIHDQTVHARFRSVETWLRKGGDWKMIGSQTVALFDDPPEIALPPASLDEYVGTYSAGPGMTLALTHEGDRLLAAATDGRKVRQAAEVRDVLFTPGRPRWRKVFQRDADGRVTGFFYRHEGHDLYFRKL
jgi:hypothetical protein